MADSDAEQHAQAGAGRSERRRFGEDDRQDLPAGRADRAQDRDVAPALHHGEADSAIDEQCADEQGEQAHRREVG